MLTSLRREHVLLNNPEVMTALESAIKGPVGDSVPGAPQKRRRAKKVASEEKNVSEAVQDEENAEDNPKAKRSSKRAVAKDLAAKQLRMIRAVSDAAFPPGKSPLGELMASPHLLLDSPVESPGTTTAAELPQAKG